MRQPHPRPCTLATADDVASARAGEATALVAADALPDGESWPYGRLTDGEDPR